MKTKKEKRIIIALGAGVLLIIGSRWTLKGVPAPFCSGYYTETVVFLDNVPDADSFIHFLLEDGWEITGRDWYDSAEGRGLVRAEKTFSRFFSRPKVKIRLVQAIKDPKYQDYRIAAKAPPEALDPNRGLFGLYTEEGSGNKIANKILYYELAETFKEKFNIEFEEYDYRRNCD